MRHVEKQGYGEHVTPAAGDVLDSQLRLPGDVHAVWMSQFISCFSADEMCAVLMRARQSLADDGSLFIMDTFWDCQSREIASYCLLNTSAYFTAIANGNSRMYALPEVVNIVARAGLALQQRWDDIGYCRTLLRFART